MRRARILIAKEEREKFGTNYHYQLEVDGEVVLSSIYSQRESKDLGRLLPRVLAGELSQRGVLKTQYEFVNGESIDETGQPIDGLDKVEDPFANFLKEEIDLMLGGLAIMQ